MRVFKAGLRWKFQNFQVQENCFEILPEDRHSHTDAHKMSLLTLINIKLYSFGIFCYKSKFEGKENGPKEFKKKFKIYSSQMHSTGLLILAY